MIQLGKPLENGYSFISKFDIGDPCIVFDTLKGHIRTITFTTGKVRYSVYLLIEETTIHNIDSYHVQEREGEKIEFDFDNYS